VPIVGHSYDTVNVSLPIAKLAGVAGSQDVGPGDILVYVASDISATVFSTALEGNVSGNTDAIEDHFPVFAGIATTLVNPGADAGVSSARVAAKCNGLAYLLTTHACSAGDIMVVEKPEGQEGGSTIGFGERRDTSLFAGRGHNMTGGEGRNAFKVLPMKDAAYLHSQWSAVDVQKLLAAKVGRAVAPGAANTIVEVYITC
jgi:hypothetical protein